MAGGNFVYRIAETREDVEGAVRLVYRNYIELKYCSLNRFEVHFYLYDVLPETRTLVALHGDRVVATLTLVFDSPLGLPSGKLYGAELGALRASGRGTVEISKLSVDRDLGARGLAVLKGLFRLAWLTAARVRGATDFVIMVEPHHERFYVNSLLFERLGELKPDPEAAGAPSVLLRLDLKDAPGRYLARFGEEPRPSNPYWFFCLEPEVAGVEASARAADGRLSEMNRRVETGRRLPNPTSEERRYIDYRLFSIAFVTDKTCREAERRRQNGLFREELLFYERLLAALPPDYAPERRGRILIAVAKALWNGCMYERALALADQARELVVDADLRGDAGYVAAATLQATGRPDQARERLRGALEDPRLSAFLRAKLLSTDGRVAVSRLDFAGARRSLYEARRLAAPLGNGEMETILRAYLAHDIHVLEYRSGQVTRALAELQGAGPLFEAAGPVARLRYREGLAKIENLMLRPGSALEQMTVAIREETPDTSRFNSAVLRFVSAEACLMLGRLAEAERFARESLAAARSVQNDGIVADAIFILTEVSLAGDDMSGAARMVEENRGVADGTAHPGARRALDAAAGLLAVAGRRWDEARELHRRVAESWGSEPASGALARCALAEVGLLAGADGEASRLAAALPPPESMPGHLAYEARWRTLRSALLALSDDDAGAERELSRAIELYRPGGCLRDQAEAALLVLDALSAGQAGKRCARTTALARSAARSAVEAAGLPARARRLAAR